MSTGLPADEILGWEPGLYDAVLARVDAGRVGNLSSGMPFDALDVDPAEIPDPTPAEPVNPWPEPASLPEIFEWFGKGD